MRLERDIIYAERHILRFVMMGDEGFIMEMAESALSRPAAKNFRQESQSPVDRPIARSSNAPM